MKKYLLQILSSPVTHFNVLIVGFFILVGVMHNHAHYTMEVDADSYVRAFCKNSPEICKSYVDDYDY